VQVLDWQQFRAGDRVVVRTYISKTAPGSELGKRFSDVIGIVQANDAARLTLQKDAAGYPDHSVVVINWETIAAAKKIPPRPTRQKPREADRETT